MNNFNTEITTTIPGEEHRPEYAEKNAYAFLAMAKGVAETYGLDQDEIRIENQEHTDHFFVVQESGETETYPVANPDADVNYEDPQEQKKWQRSMTLGQFEESLDAITSDQDMELHGLSRGMKYRRKSSTPTGMMEGFGGPRRVPTEYGDSIIYISDRDKEVRYCFEGAPNSGASIQSSLTEKGLMKVQAMLSGKSEEDILIERHQSGEKPYATLIPIQENELRSGMDDLESETIEEIVGNIDEFDVEIR